MPSDMLISLQNRCAGRECCSSDVLGKLRRAGVPGEEAVKILQELRSGKWVDDRRYAGCFAREKAMISGWGPVKIRYHLSLKGIAEEDIASALEDVDSQAAFRRMSDVLGQKWDELCRKEGDRLKRRAKMMRFAAGRGYRMDDVWEVLRKTGRETI